MPDRHCLCLLEIVLRILISNVSSGLKFFDADDFHPEKNVAKMGAGEPLTDEDRYFTIFSG